MTSFQRDIVGPSNNLWKWSPWRIESPAGLIVFERVRTRGEPVVSDKSDPPFQHMVGWDRPKASKWVDYRGWKLLPP